MSSHTLPPYPADSVKLLEQGTSRLNVTIGRDGVPDKLAINLTSGFPRLDQAALNWVKQTWRWQALDKACPAASVTTLVDVVWSLYDANNNSVTLTADDSDFPPDALAKGEYGLVVLDILMSEQGGILQRKVTRGSGFPDLDAKAIEIAARHSFHAGQMDGQPVLSSLRIYIAFKGKAPEDHDIAASP
jgi:TonB family protein